MKQYKSRNEVPENEKWDLTHIFKNMKAVELKINNLKKELKELSKQVGFAENSNALQNFLDQYFIFQEEVLSLELYSFLKLDEDATNQESLKLKGKIDNFGNEIEINLAFVIPTLMRISKNKWKQFQKENKNLIKYNNWLMQLQHEKEHSLNAETEELISRLTQTMNSYEDICDTLIDSELDYGFIEGEPLTSSNYRKWIMNENRDIRKKTSEQYFEVLKKHKNTFASLYYNYLKNFNEIAKIRHYKNSQEAALKGSNINEKIIDQLIKTTKDNIKPFHNYLELRKEVLQLDLLHPYDLTIPLAKSKKKYTIEETKEIILKSLSILGVEYTSIIKTAFEDNWIDFANYKGKKSGAYCAHIYNYHPNILMTYNGDLDSISTIIHELGHAANAMLSKKNPSYESNTDMFLVEIASLTNEFLLSDYILKNSEDKQEQLAAIYNNLHLIKNNLFTCIYDAELENDIHNNIFEDNYISAEFLQENMLKHKQEILGNHVVHGENSSVGWTVRTHYFRPFYLFKYATSVCIAASVASKIINKDESFINKYLDFLASGSKKWPLEILSDLGISLETDQVYVDAIKYFDELVNQFRNIYKEVNE